jgi:hypothetical protein
MFGRTWSHNTIRKYIVLFGTLFNNLYINRENSAGRTIQTLKIPLSYGPKEKFLARVNMDVGRGDAALSQPVAVILPRMSFEMVTMSYAPDRKLNTINKLHKAIANDTGKVAFQYSPVPYDFTFQLAIMVKNAEDGTKIIEQILPYFTPEFTATVNLAPDVDGRYDIPIILNDISTEDTYEGDFEQRRALIHTLTFTMKGYLFGPTRRSDIIKEIDVNIKVPELGSATLANTAIANTVEIQITPGLYANGSAAEWYGDGSAATRPTVVDITEVGLNQDYGFLIDFTENF